jgi:hypothetical protein
MKVFVCKIDEPINQDNQLNESDFIINFWLTFDSKEMDAATRNGNLFLYHNP